jgi:hypothetical protein
VDPCLRLMDSAPDSAPDPDPAIFVIDLQDANKETIILSFCAFYFLKEHLHLFLKIKSHKEVTKQ